MTQSIVYPTTQARFGGGGGWYAYGAHNLITPLQEAEDNIFDVIPLYAGGSSSESLGFTYDYAIPAGSSITKVEHTVRYAQNCSVPNQLIVASDIGFGIVPLSQPSLVAGGIPPKDEQWATETVTFDSDAMFPMTVPTFESHVTGGIPQSLGGYFPTAPEGSFFLVDYFSTEVFFNLPAPSIGAAPTFFNLERNNFHASGVVTIPIGTVNSSYPVTAYFEFIEQDPTAGGASSISLGQGQIQTSAVTEISSVADADARNVVVRAQIPQGFDPQTRNVLVPGKTYWVRLVASNADNKVSGPWGSVTTPQFDSVLGG